MSATADQKLEAAKVAAKIVVELAFDGRVGHGNTAQIVHRQMTKETLEFYALSAIREYERLLK